MSDDEDASIGFQFGADEETIVMKIQDGLPYNPFTFDIGLHIIKTIPPYENDLFFNITTGCKTVFGRKKSEVEHVLKAPTISSRHFMIDEQKKIGDLGSSKGTFLWVNRQKSAEVQEGKIFLIGTSEVVVQKVSYNQRKIWLKIKEDIIQVNRQNSPFLFGKHPNCNYRLNCPQQYLAFINVFTLKLHSFLQDEDCDQQKGVWQRLSPSKMQSDLRQLQSEDLVMAFPYIFKVEY